MMADLVVDASWRAGIHAGRNAELCKLRKGERQGGRLPSLCGCFNGEQGANISS